MENARNQGKTFTANILFFCYFKVLNVSNSCAYLTIQNVWLKFRQSTHICFSFTFGTSQYLQDLCPNRKILIKKEIWGAFQTNLAYESCWISDSWNNLKLEIISCSDVNVARYISSRTSFKRIFCPFSFFYLWTTRYYCLAACSALVKYMESMKNIVLAPSSMPILFEGAEKTALIGLSSIKSSRAINGGLFNSFMLFILVLWQIQWLAECWNWYRTKSSKNMKNHFIRSWITRKLKVVWNCFDRTSCNRPLVLSIVYFCRLVFIQATNIDTLFFFLSF